MSAPRRKSKNEIARLLGAERAVPVRRSRGPLDLLHLAHEAQQRLRSSGGRPTDPNWTMTRQIPFSAGTWRRLEESAAQLSQEAGRKVSPGQLAALLIERAVHAEREAAGRSVRVDEVRVTDSTHGD